MICNKLMHYKFVIPHIMEQYWFLMAEPPNRKNSIVYALECISNLRIID